MCHWIYTTAFAAAGIALAGPAAAQSFDCTQAQSDVEKMICGDPFLSELDTELGKTYKSAEAQLSGSALDTFKEIERNWIAKRDACTTSECISAAYDARLKTISEEIDVFPGWEGSYDSWTGQSVTITKAAGTAFNLTLEGGGPDWLCEGSAEAQHGESGLELTIMSHDGDARIVATGTSILLTSASDTAFEDVFKGDCGAQAPPIEGFYARRN